VASEPTRGVDGDWDEGLAPERTQLAWGRTGLAVVVAVGVLARRAWTERGSTSTTTLAALGLAVVGAGALAWMAGMRGSRQLEEAGRPHGLHGRRAFALISGGTVLLAVGGLVFDLLVHR